MWHLEAFDKKSHLIVDDYDLPGLTTDAVRDLLRLEATVEIGGRHYPLEAGGYDVPVDTLPSLGRFLDDPSVIHLDVDFQLCFD